MRKLKGFTLVEILIVIVIIGILIGALVPRMQSAQGRARDVARKNDLSQIQSAIITSYSDRGEWPALGECTLSSGGCPIYEGSTVGNALLGAGLNGIPNDPIKGNSVAFQSGHTYTSGYGYFIAKKNGVENAGFLLMAHTEVEGGSNWVDCGTSGSSESISKGRFPSGTDLRYVIPCSRLTQTGSAGGCSVVTGGTCYYENTTQLRYILVY